MRRAICCLVLLVIASSYGAGGRADDAEDEVDWDPDRTHVFCVGLLQWEREDLWASFPACIVDRRDEQLVQRFCAMGVPDDQITYLQDAQATKAAIQEAFKALSTKRMKGTCWSSTSVGMVAAIPRRTKPGLPTTTPATPILAPGAFTRSSTRSKPDSAATACCSWPIVVIPALCTTKFARAARPRSRTPSSLPRTRTTRRLATGPIAIACWRPSTEIPTSISMVMARSTSKSYALRRTGAGLRRGAEIDVSGHQGISSPHAHVNDRW